MINKTLSAIMLCGILSGTVSASDPWGASGWGSGRAPSRSDSGECTEDSDAADHRTETERLQAELDAERETTRLLKLDLSGSQGELTWMRGELSWVRAELSAASAQSEEFSRAAAETRALNEDLMSELLKVRELNEELASAATDRDEVSRLRAQLAESDAEIASLRDRLAEFAAENERLRAERDGAGAAGHGVAPAYGSGVAPEMETLRAENAELLAQVARVRAELEDSRERTASLNGQVSELQEALWKDDEQKRDELAASRAQILEFQQELARLELARLGVAF